MYKQSENLPMGISEASFMEELQKGMKVVDAGIKKYFILVDNAAFKNVRQIGNTTLKDIQSVFGIEYIPLFRFATTYTHARTGETCIDTLRIRPLTKNDKKRLRNTIKFFPNDCWVCEWADAHTNLLLPFIQKDNGEIFFLHDIDSCRKKECSGFTLRENTAAGAFIKTIIENMPEYAICDLARVRYRHTDILIPIPQKTGKTTFKNREKDANGIRRRLIHEVQQHDRQLEKGDVIVKSHLRGTSDFTIKGIDVELIASYELSSRYAR